MCIIYEVCKTLEEEASYQSVTNSQLSYLDDFWAIVHPWLGRSINDLGHLVFHQMELPLINCLIIPRHAGSEHANLVTLDWVDLAELDRVTP